MMADQTLQAQQQVFRYQSFYINKNQPLGHGSYGAVYKAKCDQLPCAAKILHPTILDPMDPGARTIMDRFNQECAFLEGIRHPNIVQYLGMTMDPESRLPVLLMELLDESLTKTLERSQQLLPYYIQVDICHDIALAVAYLHSNNIIHRDLSSNNVLIIAGRRAKVTDFGMSKLAGATPTMTPLTMCPGTLAYMSPEALREPPTYTKKLDCFSEGVIMIQVCTRLWPEPGPRTRLVPFPESPTGMTEVPVLETERRKNHIDLINPTQQLLPIAMDCLKYQKEERPSSEELCQRLAALKEFKIYRDSTKEQQGLLTHNEEEMVRQLRQLNQQLEEQKQVTAEIQQTNHALQRQVEQLQQQLSQQSLRHPHHKPRLLKMTLRWRDGGKAPIKMRRGAAVVNGSVAYFMDQSGEACSYNSTTRKWIVLPASPYQRSSLVVINGKLTAIGGQDCSYNCTDKLLSLRKNWVDVFPPMPTKRFGTTAVMTMGVIIVAGGTTGRDNKRSVSTVEVMDTKTLAWSTVASLPHPYYAPSATICGDHLYMLGGWDNKDKSKSVLTSSLTELLQSSSSSVWHRVADAPAYFSTCAAVNGALLAVGGCDKKLKEDTAIHKYNITTNSWELISNMPTTRRSSLVVVLPTNELMAIGGGILPFSTDKVEIATFSFS